MLFAWWKRRRRQRILEEAFPAAWLDYLANNVFFYELLAVDEQAKLRDDLRLFCAEKSWEGCGGLTVTAEVKVTIAAQACLLTLALPEDSYSRVPTILVYPSGYIAGVEQPLGVGDLGVHGESHELGAAIYRGPVRLAWDEVLRDGRDSSSGRNLVFHEFAHQLDMLDGYVNGTPPIGEGELLRRWQVVMEAEYDRLTDAVDRGRPTFLDPYGAQDEGEFFAVVTESFFTVPMQMQERHSRLYALLRDYFRQDPAARIK